MSVQVLRISLLALVIGTCMLAGETEGKNVVCYFVNWAQYRPGLGKHDVSNIDPNLCTHLIFAFAQLDGNQIKYYEETDNTPNGMWSQFNALKKINPNLKTLLAIGGYSHGPQRFSTMVATKESRTEFINAAINHLRYWNFDGLDIDWEYPGAVSTDDREKLSLLLQEAHEAFQAEGTITNRNRLLLAAALPAGLEKANQGYHVPTLDKYLDIMNIMTYDYHGSWEKETGLASPLLAPAGDPLSVVSTINWYRSQGASLAKINVGLSFFGRSWTLSNSGATAVGSSAPTTGTAGEYTRNAGTLAYYEVCTRLRSGYTIETDPIGQVKYAYQGNQWVTYEDVDTLKIKLDWILSEGFGGAMIWSLDFDDFTGSFCNQGRYPLLKTVSEKMLSAPGPDTTPKTTTTTTTTMTTKSTTTTTTTRKPTTKAPTQSPPTAQPPKTGGSYTCDVPHGIFADPESCESYYVCAFVMPFKIQCPTGTIFNADIGKCENRSTTTFTCTV